MFILEDVERFVWSLQNQIYLCNEGTNLILSSLLVNPSVHKSIIKILKSHQRSLPLFWTDSAASLILANLASWGKNSEKLIFTNFLSLFSTFAVPLVFWNILFL